MNPPRLPLICSLLLVLYTTAPAETEVEGPVSGVWSAADSPFIAIADITVTEDDTLTIEPGVEVRFDGNFGFSVSGLLMAEGSEDDSILFAPAANDRWKGLQIEEANANSLLSYCIIRNGRKQSGGNLTLINSDITLEHSRFSLGSAENFGGGITVDGGEPVIRRCLFSLNESGNAGGALLITNGAAPAISECVFESNATGSFGGAVCFLEESTPTLRSSVFRENESSANGGAVAILESADPVVSHCDFIENGASAGGAVYIRDEDTEPLLEWNYFYANATIEGDRVGGALYIRGRSPAEVRYCRFRENDANYGGAVYVKEPPHCNLHHNLFDGNGALRAGGAVGTSSDLGETPLELRNCTFIRNRGTGQEPNAVVAYAREGAYIHINSSIIWNEGPLFGEEGRVSVGWSQVIQEVEGEGNSTANPGFFELDSTLLMLRGDSPCVDSGDPDLPQDSDSTRGDRGWLHFPRDAWDALEPAEGIASELTTIDRDSLTITLRNDSGVPFYATPLDRWQPHPILDSVDVSEITGDSQIQAAAWTADAFVLAGGNSGEGPAMMYLLDGEFEPAGDFEQPGGGAPGFLDLATAGNRIIYGGDEGSVYEFTTEGEQGERYPGPEEVAVYRALGLDRHYAYNNTDFYIGGDEGFIIRADGEMWERDRLEVGDTIRALGVKWNTRALYIVTESQPGGALLSLLNPDDGAIFPLYQLPAPGERRMGGFEVTQNYEEGRGTLIGVWKGDGEEGDLLFAEDLYTAWLVIQPKWQLLMPGDSAEWSVVVAGDQMPEGRYESNFWVAVNGYGEGGEVGAVMDLTQSVVGGGAGPLPVSSGYLRVSPNPCNAAVRVEFNLTAAGSYRLRLTDISGRSNGLLEFGSGAAGRYSRVFNAGDAPSGRYYIILETATGSRSIPVTIIK